MVTVPGKYRGVFLCLTSGNYKIFRRGFFDRNGGIAYGFYEFSTTVDWYELIANRILDDN